MLESETEASAFAVMLDQVALTKRETQFGLRSIAMLPSGRGIVPSLGNSGGLSCVRLSDVYVSLAEEVVTFCSGG